MASESSSPEASENEGEAQALTHEVRFRIGVLRNIRYNEERGRYHTFLHKFFMIIVIAAAGFFVGVLVDSIWHFLLPLIVIVAGAIDMVTEPSAKAAQHTAVRRDLLELYRVAETGKESLDVLSARYKQIHEDESAKMHVINTVALNSAARTFDRPRSLRRHVPTLYLIFGHLIPFTNTEFRTIGEINWPTGSWRRFLLRLFLR